MIDNNTKQFTSWHIALLKFLHGLITSTNVWLLKVSKGRPPCSSAPQLRGSSITRFKFL